MPTAPTPPSTPATAPAPQPLATDPQRTRAALVGCGGISKAWLDALVTFDDVEIVALVDLALPAAEARRSDYPQLQNAAVGTDLAAVIEEHRPDLVFDCTVPAAHDAVAATALGAGCDLLAEKPMASSVAAAVKLRDLATEKGRVYAVIQNRRFFPGMRRFCAVAQDGTLGQLTELHADFAIGAHFGGFRDTMDHPLIIDMAIHHFDAARAITGEDPVAVYAHGFNPHGSWYEGDPAAYVIFEFTNGVRFNYRGSWCAEGLNTSWNARWKATGTKGSAGWDGETALMGQVLKDPENGEGFTRELTDLDLTDLPAMPRVEHAAMIRHYLDARAAGEPPETAAADNIKTLAMVYAAVESSESGRRVEIAV